ncbi:MAG: hypothetical protein HYV95_12620 [Opitutae bacterium]|nr:hypothetical protein [Opitutae bacterium]
MTTRASFFRRPWIWAALILTLFKLWLTRGQGVWAIGSAGFDDRLFLELARHLIRGDWLGPYNEMTLAKGPFYSLFIAAAFTLGLPLFLAQHLLYAAACAWFARALRPAIASPWIRLGIYALLLWNPMTFDASSMGRVLRQHVYGPLGLMIFAGLVALYLRRAESARRQAPWALLLGLAGGAFYLTREEAVWFAPSVVLLAGAFLTVAWKISRATAQRAAGSLALAAVAACTPVLIVSALNRHYYGWFGTCELRSPALQDAYGAMLRVRVGPKLPYVPVTREAREAMAAVSPSFASVQAGFKAGVARGWAGNSEFLTKLPPEQEQIGGGWMIWALREAVARAGYHHSAGQALAFYRQLAREINQACDRGRLPAGPARSGFVPLWREEQTGPFGRTAFDFTDFVVRFSRFSARAPASTGSPEELQLFRGITRERISPPAGELDVVGAAQYMFNLWKVDTLQRIGKALRPVLLGLWGLAVLVALLRIGQSVWRRQWTYPLTVAVAAAGACSASILIHAMIEVTSFPVLTISSFAPLYPLLLVFIVATLWDAIMAWFAPGTCEPGPADALAPLPAPIPAAPWPRALPWLAGLAALAPFLLWYGRFRELFWFGDDLFLLDQMAYMGLGDWITHVFSENFVPLFKLLWGGSALLFGGSYAAMLWLLWLTHAVNTLLLGRLLHRAGFPWVSVLATQIVFALTPANIESLGWSVQWSAVLATSFLLLALWWHEARRDEPGVFPWRLHLPLFLFAAASACSFSRGVLTGAVLALGLVLPAVADNWRAVPRRLPGAVFSLLPAAGVALTIMLCSSGNFQKMDGHWADALLFGGSYFLLNPLHALSGEASAHPALLLLLAALKLGAVAGALVIARGRVRQLLLLFLAFDLGNAVLIGIGRYHTGFFAALSSRYQYGALLATLPFLTLVLAAGLDRLPALLPHRWAATALLGLLAGYCLWGWPAVLTEFTGWRGTELRRLMAAPATSDPAVRVPALEFMHIERAKALQRAYHLH